MHFRYFDHLMGSTPEASIEVRFDKGRNYSENNYSSNYFTKCLKNLPKICTKFKKFPKMF